jgi:hypothetical protein
MQVSREYRKTNLIRAVAPLNLQECFEIRLDRREESG